MKVKLLCHVQLFETPWTVVYQVPLSMRFSGKNTWVGCHFLLQEIFLTQGLNPGLQHCRQTLFFFFFLPSEPPEKSQWQWWRWNSKSSFITIVLIAYSELCQIPVLKRIWLWDQRPDLATQGSCVAEALSVKRGRPSFWHRRKKWAKRAPLTSLSKGAIYFLNYLLQ